MEVEPIVLPEMSMRIPSSELQTIYLEELKEIKAPNLQKKPSKDKYGYIKIQIIDSGMILLVILLGCGISENELNKLFQPFGQASHSR